MIFDFYVFLNNFELFMDYIRYLCEEQINEIVVSEIYDLFGGFSIDTYGLAFLRNELVVNHRTSVLEFGSGLSTIFMALVIKKYSLPTKITSVEADEEWVSRISDKASALGLSSILTIIHAPLVLQPRLGQNNSWYDFKDLSETEFVSSPFDMVLVDGPPAYREDISLSRFGALPFLHEMLADDFTILLDDANRDGEKKVLALWEEEFGLHFNIYNGRLAVCRKGSYINSHPSYLNVRLHF